MQWPRDIDAELDAFYGRPDGSAKWEVQNLVYIIPPWKVYLAGTTIELTHGLRVHKKVADDLKAIFNEIWAVYGKSQAAIEAVRLHQLGGAYFFRALRGSTRLSNHARGAAVDIDPAHNEMGKNTGSMPTPVINIFKAHGWRWGGDYKGRKDFMHLEAVWDGNPLPKPTLEKPIKVVSTPVTGWVEAAAPLIKRWEGFQPSRYWDVKQYAIGYGQATKLPAEAIITEPEASAMLSAYLTELAAKVAPLLTVPVTENQGGAVLSFAYNLGIANLSKSTLLNKLNANDKTGAAEQFMVWTKAGGKVLAGLVKRRAAERDLFLTA